jgi:hypothetical protein
MTPLLSAPLLVALSWLSAGTQDSKPQTTPLEGVWRESLLPGEKAADKFSITCSGDKISLLVNKRLLEGEFEIDPLSEQDAITITVLVVNGRALKEKLVYSGSYCLEGGALYLRVGPFATQASELRGKLPVEPEKDPVRRLKQLADMHDRLQAETQSSHATTPLGLVPMTFRLEKLKK